MNLKIPLENFVKMIKGEREDDFSFRVGGRIYKCNVLFAEFLSPKICALRRLDPTISQYRVPVDDPDNKFADFLSLASGEHLTIEQKDLDFFALVANELQNEVILSHVDSEFSSMEITTTNAVDFLRRKLWFKDKRKDAAIAYIAENFATVEGLSTLDVHHLFEVLSHPSLRVPNEKFLYDFICDMVSNDESFYELFVFVKFMALDQESIAHFFELSRSFIHKMTPQLWNALSQRFIKDSVSETREHSLKEQQESAIGNMTGPLDENGTHPAFRGIFAHMSVLCGGNPAQKGLVEVSVSTSAFRSSAPYKLLDYHNDKVQVSTGKERNAWIQLDMKENRVCLAYYSLRACESVPSPPNWVIEGTNDEDDEWTVLDERHGEFTRGMQTWKVADNGSRYYRYFRIRHINVPCWHMNLRHMEIFGKIMSGDDYKEYTSNKEDEEALMDIPIEEEEDFLEEEEVFLEEEADFLEEEEVLDERTDNVRSNPFLVLADYPEDAELSFRLRTRHRKRDRHDWW